MSSVIQFEGQLEAGTVQEPNLRASVPKLFGKVDENLDIMSNIGCVMIWDHRNITQRFPINHSLSIVVGKFGSGSTRAFIRETSAKEGPRLT